MRQVAGVFAMAGLAVLTGCAQPQQALAPAEQAGWMTYSDSRIRAPIRCGEMPILLTGSRLDTHLTGACRRVRIAGTHSDVEVDIVPGGTIEITGSNNDVFWTQIGPGPRPVLIDSGTSNTFHRREP